MNGIFNRLTPKVLEPINFVNVTKKLDYGNNDAVLFPFITKAKQVSIDFSPIPG